MLQDGEVFARFKRDDMELVAAYFFTLF